MGDASYDAEIELIGSTEGLRLSGRIYNDRLTEGGHPFCDGEVVSTSPLVALEGMVAVTRSGSRYRLRDPRIAELEAEIARRDAMAAAPVPPAGEVEPVCWGIFGRKGHLHGTVGQKQVALDWRDEYLTCGHVAPLYAHPTEPAARDGGEADAFAQAHWWWDARDPDCTDPDAPLNLLTQHYGPRDVAEIMGGCHAATRFGFYTEDRDGEWVAQWFETKAEADAAALAAGGEK